LIALWSVNISKRKLERLIACAYELHEVRNV